MTQRALELLRQDETRLVSRGLFGAPGDSLSIRVPGQNELLLRSSAGSEPTSVQFDAEHRGEAEVHVSIYEVRPDVGAILIAKSAWSSAVAHIGVAVPSLFDEQARHIGKTHRPVPSEDPTLAIRALRNGGNVAIYGTRRICLGSTAGRLVLNADLFEKCAKAFVLARSSGARVSVLPWWIRWRWGRRLRRDQIRAAQSYAAGRTPEGMDAY